MQDLAVPIVFAVIFAFIGFRQYLRFQQRVLIHKERLIALEKGVDPPAWPVDPPREAIRVDGILLLSGLIWLALGIGGMIAAFAIVPQLTIPDKPPAAIALLGIPASLVGVAHLIVYRTYRKRKE